MILSNQVSVISDYFPHPQDAPDDTIVMFSGQHIKKDGSGVVVKSAPFSGPSFSAVSSGQERYDVVAIDDLGVPSILQGTPIPSGTGDPFVNSPVFPSDKLVVAIVKIDETTSVVIDESDITDSRAIIGGSGGGVGGDSGYLSYYYGDTSPQGWIVLTGANAVKTIGSQISGADFASDDAEELFLLTWDNIDDSNAPVSGGRGASSSSDFAGNKTISIPDVRGRSFIGSGQGSGLTSRTHGDTGGSETHSLSAGELPSHNHTGRRLTSVASPGFQAGTTYHLVVGNAGSLSAGSSSQHNNMQPWLSYNIICRL